MAYNEPVWARVWADHYGRQVGAEHCYLIDHGSDDGSTDRLSVHVERVSRSALDEDARAAEISDRVARLLERYDAVIHSDVDELVMADPALFADLRTFAATGGAPVLTSVGLDVQHVPKEEAAFEIGQRVGWQRRWARFSAAMCKPNFVRRAVRWSPGFHACDAPMVVGGLYLFHLRYADLGLGLRRLERTRAQSFARADTNLHQRVSDAAFTEMVSNIAQLPRAEIRFDADSEPLAGWLGRVREAQLANQEWLSVAGDVLWRIPDPWREVL